METQYEGRICPLSDATVARWNRSGTLAALIRCPLIEATTAILTDLGHVLIAVLIAVLLLGT